MLDDGHDDVIVELNIVYDCLSLSHSLTVSTFSNSAQQTNSTNCMSIRMLIMIVMIVLVSEDH